MNATNKTQAGTTPIQMNPRHKLSGLDRAFLKEERAMERAKAKEDRAWERTMTKKAEAWEKSFGSKNQPRRNR